MAFVYWSEKKPLEACVWVRDLNTDEEMGLIVDVVWAYNRRGKEIVRERRYCIVISYE